VTRPVHEREVRVRVPATSANLGPGFDALGLALSLHDEVVVRVVPAGLEGWGAEEPVRAEGQEGLAPRRGPAGGLTVDVVGEGADEVARDPSNLLVRALYAGLAHLGVEGDAVPPLAVACTNRIPHSRGLGSSAAAIVAGLVAARALVRDGGGRCTDEALLTLATEMEGHPDNVAACLLGGFTIAWREPGRVGAVRRTPAAELAATVLVPPSRASTAEARGLLPPTVPHEDAARNAARAALLVEAVTHRPDLLLVATEDALHQRYRAPAMPQSVRLVDQLRAGGLAAVVSGAGPTVLVLGSSEEAEAAVAACPGGWEALRLPVDGVGARVLAAGDR